MFSPLAQGLLTDRYLERHPGRLARRRRAAGSPRRTSATTYLERVTGLNAIAQERGQTLAQLALTWVLRHPQVTSALIGASSVAQLESSLGAAKAAPLTDDELAAIEPFAVDGTEQRG